MKYSIIIRYPDGQETRTEPSADLSALKFGYLMNKLLRPDVECQIEPPLPEDTPALTPPEFMRCGINVMAAMCQQIFGTPVQTTQGSFDLYTQIPLAPRKSSEGTIRFQVCTMDEIKTLLVVFDIKNIAQVLVAFERIVDAFDGRILTPGSGESRTEDPGT